MCLAPVIMYMMRPLFVRRIFCFQGDAIFGAACSASYENAKVSSSSCSGGMPCAGVLEDLPGDRFWQGR